MGAIPVTSTNGGETRFDRSIKDMLIIIGTLNAESNDSDVFWLGEDEGSTFTLADQDDGEETILTFALAA